MTGSFIPLLAALLAILVVMPFAEGQPLLSTILVVSLLITGLFAVYRNVRLRRILVLAILFVLIIRWLAHSHGEEHKSLVVAAHLSISLYLFIIHVICVATILRRERITRDTVIGAVCGYILIAYVFTFIYAVLADTAPDSFSSNVVLPVAYNPGRIGSRTPELMYYSFVTLTTAGYGDIVPASRIARSMAILEMLTGQLYLAAFVARLVGVMGSEHRAPL